MLVFVVVRLAVSNAISETMLPTCMRNRRQHTEAGGRVFKKYRFFMLPKLKDGRFQHRKVDTCTNLQQPLQSKHRFFYRRPLPSPALHQLQLPAREPKMNVCRKCWWNARRRRQASSVGRVASCRDRHERASKRKINAIADVFVVRVYDLTSIPWWLPTYLTRCRPWISMRQAAGCCHRHNASPFITASFHIWISAVAATSAHCGD